MFIYVYTSHLAVGISCNHGSKLGISSGQLVTWCTGYDINHIPRQCPSGEYPTCLQPTFYFQLLPV